MLSVFAIVNLQNSRDMVTASFTVQPVSLARVHAYTGACCQTDASCDIHVNLECDWSILDHPLLNRLLQDRRNAQ